MFSVRRLKFTGSLCSLSKRAAATSKQRRSMHCRRNNRSISRHHHTSFSTQASTKTAERASSSQFASSFSAARKTIALMSVSLATGYAIGRLSAPPRSNPAQDPNLQLPDGLPRTCCQDNDQSDTPLTLAQQELPAKLARIVGSDNVLSQAASSSYLRGARVGGGGEALCVVTPTSLLAVKKCVQLIVNADCTIIVQGANTGLTGGSVPRPKSTTTSTQNRPVVLLSMTKHLDTIFPIDNGNRVVCLAGAGLASLHGFLETQFSHRESHSTLGSTFLNPTAAAGVALGSGGTQCRKGSAYTDRAMYLRIYQNKWKETVVQVVNTLGIDGIEDEDFPYNSGSALEQLDIYQKDVKEGYSRAMAVSSSKSKQIAAKASDEGYAERLCQPDESVSRCNADTRGQECNRSEGKVVILATVHDTFPKPKFTKSFWLSFDSLETALTFRRTVCLDNAEDVPMSLEYMDRDSFDVIDRSGRVLGNLIRFVGPTSPIVRTLWNAKLWIESLPFEAAPLWCDRLLYAMNPWVPATLPQRMVNIGRNMDHHVAMTVGEFGSGTMDRLLDRMQKFASQHGAGKIVIHECESASESASLTAFRFVAAPAFRTWCVGQGLQGFSVDYALPKNGGTAPTLSTEPVKRMRYSHFGCNVVHEDLAYPKNVDIHEAKMELKKTVERDCGGKLPAEHGHGMEYVAPPETQERWKSMDPLNVLNPGIGGLNDRYQYKE